MTKFHDYNGNLYGVYLEYDSNFKGDFSLSICSDSEITNTNEKIVIESNDYKIFNVNSIDNLSNIWQKIWDLEIKESLNRSYTIDYEKYSQDKITVQIALI